MEVTTPYVQTELGAMPRDWSISTANDICERVVDCKNRTPPVVAQSSYAVARTPNVRNGRFVRDELRFTDEQSFKEWTTRATPQIGDVLITREAPLGEVCLVPHDLQVCLGQRMMLYRPDESKVNSTYLLYALMSSAVQKGLQRKIGGSTVGHAKVDDIRFIQLPLPPTTEEQSAIASALSDADALIDSLEQLLTKKRQIKQGTMQELLTGKRRLRRVDDWHTLRLGDAATLKARIGWQGLTTAEYRESGEHLLVTGTEFVAGRIRWHACHYVDQDRYEQDKNIQLAVNDVLVTKDGTIGKVALVDSLSTPATLNSGVFVVRPRNMAFHPGFFYCLLASPVFTSFLGQLSAGSTINHLYQKDFVHFTFDAPKDLLEQQEIYEVISDIDSDIAALEGRLTKARALKQAMAQALLTGRIRLVEPAA